jgi:protein-S-isoprenylcysteine O-methyltransferase Ste14
MKATNQSAQKWGRISRALIASAIAVGVAAGIAAVILVDASIEEIALLTALGASIMAGVVLARVFDQSVRPSPRSALGQITAGAVAAWGNLLMLYSPAVYLSAVCTCLSLVLLGLAARMVQLMTDDAVGRT